ncbi:MAG: Lrp/AsnC family transcriptional regulator [Bacteroidetes bacterium]|nr:Lrp/AsnC family transcriptional regulator [Rhodothermia bacterium]MCS7154614.1 Lrp/AsnC family transcriptional regulator [Bacteroidota bacterium]MCX7906331.1 Lrp/AsnC family transcriptional regulator [Bacteroidota bacterium]MDW8137407.1 Lrp/AsnC family transcriptional regulator [Bacteroidota bacterium]MDW8285639.1 Lrp/AsnC family transcriptional regulator [Bacteroidota bacterium]
MLDELDLKILDYLQRNGRATYREIAEAVHLSPPSVHQRVKRLEREGYILGYRAVVARDKLGPLQVAFVQVVTKLDTDSLALRLEGMPEVREVHSLTGSTDYLIRIEARTPEQLERVITAIQRIPEIERTITALVLSTRVLS